MPVEKFLENINRLEEFDIRFLLFLQSRGYVDQILCKWTNKIKLQNYMDEFAKNYSYEKKGL